MVKSTVKKLKSDQISLIKIILSWGLNDLGQNKKKLKLLFHVKIFTKKIYLYKFKQKSNLLTIK